MTDTSTTVASAASVSPDYSVYLAREAERDRLDAELLPANKAALFEALAAAGIVTVVVSFDGYGDSGQIEAIEAHNEQGEATLTSTACSESVLTMPAATFGISGPSPDAAWRASERE